jgi:hypothetical protein
MRICVLDNNVPIGPVVEHDGDWSRHSIVHAPDESINLKEMSIKLGTERAIQSVAIATPEDLNANAEFFSPADSIMEMTGGGGMQKNL